MHGYIYEGAQAIYLISPYTMSNVTGAGPAAGRAGAGGLHDLDEARGVVPVVRWMDGWMD